MSIVVNNLTKKFGPQRAVDNISFEVKTGEILGFLGPNGAGKTTTMKIITCYMAPSDGNVKVNSMSVLEEQDAIKKKIGYLPENNPLYYDMPVLEYLEFVAELQGVPKEKMNLLTLFIILPMVISLNQEMIINSKKVNTL